MVKVKTAARFIWNISRMQLKPRRAPWHSSFCCLYAYKYEKSGTICGLFKRLRGKKKKKPLMKQDPNELHVAMENKSIKVGGVSAGEQLYDFVVGWCYLIYFYFGCAILIHLEKVAVTAVSAYSGIHNWVTSLLNLTVTKRDKVLHFYSWYYRILRHFWPSNQWCRWKNNPLPWSFQALLAWP